MVCPFMLELHMLMLVLDVGYVVCCGGILFDFSLLGKCGEVLLQEQDLGSKFI